MNEKTHAEIVAEMRYKTGAICPWQVNGGTCELCPLGHSPHGRDLGKYCSFHKLAQDLDAAHKREIDEAERRANHAAMKNVSETLAKVGPLYDAESIGNAAKLREVVGDLLYMAERYVKKTPATESAIFDAKTKKEIRTVNYYDVIAKAQAALAAPARNCDVYTADELKVIFKRELVSELPIANEHEKNLITITAMRMIDTLFATSKEGGNDGNE